MFKVLSLFLLVAGSVRSYESERWPFQLADKYVEEIKSRASALAQAAAQNEFEEQSFSSKHYDESEVKKDEIEYDFIIVGGGTSGSVIANRLSQVPEWKVLLLEAGGLENQATQIPSYWQLLENTPLSWGYTTTPQNYSCLGMVDQKCAIPTGRALGGTTSINSMVYTRGNPRDYDIWADEDNKEWCYADILPFFKKVEDAHFEHFDHTFHHRGGFQHLQYNQHLTVLADHVLAAGKELGIHCGDYNGKNQLGIGTAQLTTKCGQRQSTARAYLEPAEKRDNLVVRPLSQVVKILVSPHIKEAKGVQYIHDGKLFVAKANKEVILAAGALNTPKILMLSGIGTKEECDKHKIDQIIDLKVGHNLRTRPVFLGLDFVYNKTKLEATDDSNNFINYLKHGKGPLTSPGVEALAYLKTAISKGHPTYPDIELQFSSKHYTEFDRLKAVRLAKEQYNSVWKPLEGKEGINVAVILTRPKSTGYVALKDNDPLHHPIIEPHLLSDSHESDLHTILAGIHKALEIVHTEAFKKLGATLNHNPVHGCEKLEFASDDYWTCAIKYLVTVTGDVSGTTKMGSESDKDAVVDNKLRVHGIHNLRVADASVIPVSITGGLTAPTIMIGEKAAHLIKTEWE